jgi:hypothetical protein
MDPLDKIVAIDLVLKQAPGASAYQTRLHEISGDETDRDLKLLDAGEYRGNWHTFHVADLVDSVDGDSGKRNYRLLLSISGGEDAGNILREAKPMLLIYINDQGQSGGEVDEDEGVAPTSRDRSSRSRSRTKESRGRSLSGQGHRRRRRDVSGVEPTSQTVSLSDMQNMSCRKQTRITTFRELGWPGAWLFTVLSPVSAHFSFCAGTCSNPLNPGTTNYTNHAKLISLSEPQLARVTPCCVPTKYTPIPIKYTSRFSKVLTMTTYPIAESCGCM